MRTPPFLLVLIALLAIACNPADPAEPPGALTDAGGDEPDAGGDMADAGHAPDAGNSIDPVDPFEANARALLDPLVAADGSHPDRAVGLVAVMVSPSRELVLGIGAPRIGEAEPPDESTYFQIGSVTKALTGLMLAGAVEAGELALDDAVNQHLGPDLIVSDYGTSAITLRHLVSHFSGLPHSYDNPTGPMGNPGVGYQRSHLSDFLSRVELERPPGTAYGYSNVGIGVLGNALMDRDGAPDFETLLRTRLTGPLGMARAGTNTPERLEAIAPALAQGYLATPMGLREFEPNEMGALAASGEVIMTGDDARRLLRALIGLDAFPVPGTVERSIEVLGEGGPGGRVGYAWEITNDRGVDVYFKPGSVMGYTGYLAFTREPAAGVFVMANRGSHMEVPAAALELLHQLGEE